MSLIQWMDLQALGDDRGSLVAIEGQKTVPFDIKRVYYLFDTKEGVSRGYHAHCDLNQLLVCVTGHCDVYLDDGQKRSVARLNDPTKGLLLESMVWREMHNFSSDCVLLVLASEHYDESDYIRDYQQFLRELS